MFAKRIVKLRKQKELTQEELAVYLGISRSALSLYEIGKREPDTETMLKIASFFNVSTDYLLGIADENQSYGHTSYADQSAASPGENNIRYWLTKTGLSDTEICTHISVPENLLDDYITGTQNIPLSVLTDLSTLCNASTDCLLGLRETSRPEQDGIIPFRFDPEVSQRLKDQAKQMDESYGVVADMLGIEESEVFNFFEYGFVPHLDVFVKIVEHFVVSSDYLLNRTSSTMTVHVGEERLLRAYRALNEDSKTIALSELLKLGREEALVAAKDKLLLGKSSPLNGTEG